MTDTNSRTAQSAWAALIELGSDVTARMPVVENPRCFLVDDGPDAGMIVIEAGHVESLPTLDASDDVHLPGSPEQWRAALGAFMASKS